MLRVQDHNGRFIGIGEVSEDGPSRRVD
ncbi:tRNA pseudouridine(55) synthase TruB [Stutzerimonas xanthomarina]